MLLCDFSCIVLLFTLQHESSVSAVAALPRPIVLLSLFLPAPQQRQLL